MKGDINTTILQICSDLVVVGNGIQPVQKGAFDGVNEYALIAGDFMNGVTGDQPAYPISDSVGNMRVITALLGSARNDGKTITL